MTGAAATTSATHAGTKVEGRDPSPSPGVKPASSGSSDEVEPWDEPPSKQREPSSNPIEDMMKSAAEFLGVNAGEDEGLEDGDLPTLSLKKKRVNGQYVSGERSTRPLSPPSKAGMESNAVKDNDPPMRRSRAPTPRTVKQAAAQRQFWSQLNPPSPFESDVSRDQSEKNPDGDDDDGPDDEMAAVTAARAKTNRTREIESAPKQEDETFEGDESYRGNVAKVNSYEESGGTCIDYTLNSIGDICGTKQSAAPIKDSNRPAKVWELRDIADDAEEHTAIEVEYVDPGPAARRSPSPAASPVAALPPKKKEKKKQEKSRALSPKTAKELPTSRALDGESVELKESEATAWSSSRKNAVLAAMARKAKEDFQKHEEQVAKQGALPASPRKSESPVDDGNTSDVYNNFSPSEKRKFLKLINLGLTPTESTTRVVEERRDKEGAKGPGSSGKKRFSFWKKSGKVDAVRSPKSPTPAAASDSQSVSSTAAVGEAEDDATHKGKAEAAKANAEAEAAMNKAYSPRENDRAAAAPIPSPTNKAYSQREHDRAAAAPIASAGEDAADELELGEAQGAGSGSATEPESADSEDKEEGASSNAVAAAVAAGTVARVGVVAAHQAAVSTRQANVETTPSSTYEADDDETSEEEDDSVRGKFPRSGVNYYDGIRRELPEEEDSDDEFDVGVQSPSEKLSKGSRLAALALTPRSQGFNSLHESDRNLGEKKDDEPKPVPKSLSPLGRHPKSSNKDRSTPLSPGSSTSARRRYLGIPMLSTGTGKGFSPLEEDEDAVVAKAVQEGLSAERKGSPPDRVESSVATAAVATAAVAGTAAVTAEKSEARDIAEAPSEERPLPSMDDPFYGIDTEDTAKRSNDEVTDGGNDGQEQPLAQRQDMDTSLDSYLDSATIQSYANSQADQQSTIGGSVMSGRSAYTAGTGMTSITQSSRKRRPGAAKERIAKAKKAGTNGPAAKGWHESIRAAAASNNRQWDPQKGWVDYKDPSEEAQDASNERLRISLDGVDMGSPRGKGEQRQEERPQSPSVAVPFPPGWEKERKEMLSPKQRVETTSRDVRSAGTPPLSPRPISDSDQKIRVQPSDEQHGSSHPRSAASKNESPKARGWEDSMREASAEVSKDGRRWDPERGWVGLDKSVVGENSPLSPRKTPETDEHVSAPKDDTPEDDTPKDDTPEDDTPEDDTPEDDTPEDDTPKDDTPEDDTPEDDTPKDDTPKDETPKDGNDTVPVASPNEVFAALTKAPSEEKIKDAHDYAESETRSTATRSTANGETKMNNFIEKSSKPPTATNMSGQSTEGSDESVVAGVGEKYVQLGENGAVRSVRRDSRPKKQPSDREEKLPFHPSLRKGSSSRATKPDDSLYDDDDDKAPLLTEGSTDSTEGRAPATKVVKEKVDEDDFSLFTADDRNSIGTGSGHGSPSGRRRGTGPVDVDEVDDLDTETESEDGDEQGWEPDSYMKGQVSPGMFMKPRSERSAEPAFSAAAVSLPTKTPPKLQKSRRDTSPIRSGFTGKDITSPQEATSPREVISPFASPRAAVQSSPDVSPTPRKEGGHSIEPTVSIGDDSAGSSSVKLLAQKWEVRAKSGTQIVHDQSGDSFEYDERHVTALGDFGPSGGDFGPSGGDFDQQEDWPGADTPAGTQEWRSFIGKKVQAETAAAATLEESKKRDASNAASKPGIPRAPGPTKRVVGMDRAVNDENGDSSFSFGPSDVDDSPAMSAGSAAARRRERAQQQSSSPGGFSDVSPIPAREEDFAIDEARMERVSDTSTAVEQSNFMKRLSACAAPLSRAFTQSTSGDGVPNSHLEFLKSSPAGQSPSGSGRYVPAALCGREDVINEDEGSEDSKRSLNETQDTPQTASPPTSPASRILGEVKERSTSRGRVRRAAHDPINDMRSSSSVASDDFGARTSYLEAIALRSAVSSSSSKKKRYRRKPQDRDTRSEVSDATSESKLSHSERWQAFLERKASQTASPPGSRAQSSTDVSRAAEKYASEKMEEMMEVMASRSKSTPKSWRREDVDHTLDTSYGDSSSASPLSPYRLASEDTRSSRKSKKKRESAKAAEELAAARVEAMMAAMTSSNLDEGEI